MSLEQQISDGEAAKRLLDDPLFSNAMAQVKAAIIGQWEDLAVENKAQAEELKRLLWAAKQFEACFTVVIAGGSVAKNELLNQSTMQVRQDAARNRIYG